MREQKCWKLDDLGEINEQWWPEDAYAAYPAGLLEQDDNGRWYMPLDMDDPPPVDAKMIDTRIPLEARIPMAEGRAPVLSYREWLEKAGRER